MTTESHVDNRLAIFSIGTFDQKIFETFRQIDIFSRYTLSFVQYFQPLSSKKSINLAKIPPPDFRASIFLIATSPQDWNKKAGKRKGNLACARTSTQWSGGIFRYLRCPAFSTHRLSQPPGPFRRHVANCCLTYNQNRLDEFFRFYCWVTPILRSCVVDQYLEKYRTIFYSFIVYSGPLQIQPPLLFHWTTVLVREGSDQQL